MFNGIRPRKYREVLSCLNVTVREYPRGAHIVEPGEQSHNDEKGCYSLPYTRTELADFLCVDRSALSRELCRMRDERILDFSGAKIHLLNPTFLYGWN